MAPVNAQTQGATGDWNKRNDSNVEARWEPVVDPGVTLVESFMQAHSRLIS